MCDAQARSTGGTSLCGNAGRLQVCERRWPDPSRPGAMGPARRPSRSPPRQPVAGTRPRRSRACGREFPRPALASGWVRGYIVTAGLQSSSGALSPGPYRLPRELSLASSLDLANTAPTYAVGFPGSILQRLTWLRTLILLPRRPERPPSARACWPPVTGSTPSSAESARPSSRNPFAISPPSQPLASSGASGRSAARSIPVRR